MSSDLKRAAVSLFVWASGEGLFIYIVALHMEGLGANPVQIGLLMALISLIQAGTMAPVGLAADRWGAKRVMVLGWVWGAASIGIMAMAADLTLFAVGWLSYGFSAGAVPALTTYVSRNRGALRPEQALTRVFAAYSAGLVLSPALGGLIGEQMGLRATFVIAAGLTGLSGLVIMSVTQDNARPRVARQTRLLLPGRSYQQLLAVAFLISLALTLGVPLAPNLMQSKWNIAVRQIGLLGSIASLGEATLSLLLGGRRPSRALIALLAAGMVYLFALLYGGTMGWLALGYLMRAGTMISRQFIDAIATRLVPADRLGIAYATNAIAAKLATMASAALAGWLYDLRSALPFQLGLILIPVAMAATWTLARRERITQVPADGV